MANVHVTDYVIHPKGWSGLQEHWYHEQFSKARTSARILEIVQTVFETFSVIGLWFTFKRHDTLERLKNSLQKPVSPGPHACIIRTPYKTSHFTFNHLAEFAIYEGQIYMRREGVHWRLIHYPGKDPIFIDADGANLFVLDRDGTRYYKKVFSEFRKGHIPPRKYVHFRGVDLEKYDYYAVDKSQLANWRKHWFSLPVVSFIYHSVVRMDQKLRISDYRAIAMSHRGKFVRHYENAAGREHLNCVGTTTLFLFHKDGRSMELSDPWVAPWTKLVIPMPENETTFFEAVKASASASTVAILGFEHHKVTGQEEMKLLTRLVDVDITGGNPTFTYSYDERYDGARVLSHEIEWVEHPLPEAKEWIRDVLIMQNGTGNDARRIYLFGEKDHKSGYYTKQINERNWVYRQHDGIYLSIPLQSMASDKKSRGATVKGHWRGRPYKIPFFGEGAEGSKMLLSVGNNVYTLFLRKRFSLWNFLGINQPHVDVIIPQNLRNNSDLTSIFYNRVSVPY